MAIVTRTIKKKKNDRGRLLNRPVRPQYYYVYTIKSSNESRTPTCRHLRYFIVTVRARDAVKKTLKNNRIKTKPYIRGRVRDRGFGLHDAFAKKRLNHRLSKRR